MEIFMIIRLFGAITAFSGPLPISYEQCLDNLSLMRGIDDIPMEISCRQGGEQPQLERLSKSQLDLVTKATEEMMNKELTE